MATWRDISSDEDKTGQPVTQTLAKTWTANVTALAEAAIGAPVVRAGWYPYDQVEYADGSEGLLYDFTADGTAEYVESPTLENGYEYRMVVDGLSSGASPTPTISLFDTSSNEVTAFTWTAGSSATVMDADFILTAPRLRRTRFLVHGFQVGFTETTIAGIATFASDTRVSKFRLNMTTIDAGKVYLLRRANDLSR